MLRRGGGGGGAPLTSSSLMALVRKSSRVMAASALSVVVAETASWTVAPVTMSFQTSSTDLGLMDLRMSSIGCRSERREERGDIGEVDEEDDDEEEFRGRSGFVETTFDDAMPRF